MTRTITTTIGAILMSMTLAATAWAAYAAGVHKAVECASCHKGTPAAGNASVDGCIQCHGGMSTITLPPNKFGKDAHHSPHYADLVACTECHSEHGQSKSLCEDCHVTK